MKVVSSRTILTAVISIKYIDRYINRLLNGSTSKIILDRSVPIFTESPIEVTVKNKEENMIMEHKNIESVK